MWKIIQIFDGEYGCEGPQGSVDLGFGRSGSKTKGFCYLRERSPRAEVSGVTFERIFKLDNGEIV